MKTKMLLALGLVAVLAVTSGYGRQTTTSSLKAQIDFPFTVEGKILPPGPYKFVRDTLSTVFRVQGEGKNGVLAPILTRVAGEMRTTPQDACLVFDVVGDTYLLSEIWIPGEDGYLVLATKGQHMHKVIKAQR